MRFAKEITLLIGALILWTGALFYHSDIPRAEIIEKYSSENVLSTTVDGNTIYYSDTGEGEVILLLHGTSSFLQTWDSWAAELENEYRVIRPDLLGFGLTGAPHDLDFSLENYLESLNGLMHQLDVSSFHIVGNSFGGYLATQMAINHPEKIRSLCIINGSGFELTEVKSKTSGFSLATTPIVKNIMRYVTPKFVIESSLKSFYGNPNLVTDHIVQRYFDYLLCSDNRKSLVLKSAEPLPPLNQRLHEISCQSLIIWGESDELIPIEKGLAITKSILNSEMKTLTNTGHLPMEERPNESVLMYIEFLNAVE
jgi:pimeloyl-ACP methyl ester carboxylesterase